MVILEVLVLMCMIKNHQKKNDKLYMAWKKDLKNFKYNVIFTPHNAFFNKESYIELREKAALNIKNYFEKNRVNNRVN